MDNKKPQQIAVLGLGLMGGSLGMALRKSPGTFRVAAWARRKETREAALAAGAADEVFETPAAACKGADVVVVCAPASAVREMIAQCVGSIKPGALVTDVASVKTPIAQEAEQALAGHQAAFLGSHPIAGSEQQGIEFARPDLFAGAVIVLTPTPATKPETLAKARAFWGALNSRLRILSPDEHDRILARTSHLPHLASAALARAIGRDSPSGELADFCGTGFRDATRLAAGAAELWRDIAKTNQKHIVAELRAFRLELDRLLDLVHSGDFDGVQAFLEQARSRRGSLAAKQGAAT